MPDKLRTVIEDDHFLVQFAALSLTVARAEQILDGIKWELSADPAIGQWAWDQLFYVTTDDPMSPELVIFYTFDDDEVLLVSIEFA